MVTGWTFWDDPKYKDFYDALKPLYDESRKPVFYTEEQLKKFSKTERKELALKNMAEWSDYNKNPWKRGCEEEAEKIRQLQESSWYDVVDYCVENRIYVTDEEHQGADFGVPIIDDKYLLQLTLRTWADLMSEVWNRILRTKKYSYLDFYCSGGLSGTILECEFSKPKPIEGK